MAQQSQGTPPRFTGYLQSAGRAEKLYKGDQFIKTETARDILISLYYLQAYGLKNQEDPAITAYWNSKGLRKEIYDISDTNRMWSVFTRMEFMTTTIRIINSPWFFAFMAITIIYFWQKPMALQSWEGRKDLLQSFRGHRMKTLYWRKSPDFKNLA